MTYSPMDFRLGAVVFNSSHLGTEAIGHVTGFDRNAIGEAILRVRWDDGTETAIHPKNVTLDPATWPKSWSEAKCLERISRERSDEPANETKRRGFMGLLR